MKRVTNHLAENVAHLVYNGQTTRAELAEQLGVTVQAVGKLIRGESKGLKPLNLVNAARHLGYSVEDLVCRDLKREAPATATSADTPLAFGDSMLAWIQAQPNYYKPAEKGEIRAALDQLQVDISQGSRTALKAARLVNLLYAEV